MKKIVFIIFVFFISVTFVYADEIDVSIITKRPIVGQKIEVNDMDDLSYKWFVNNKEVSNSSYFIPDALCYESWIIVKAYFNNKEVSSDKIYFSKLPVVYINTKTNKEITRDEYVEASMYIQGNINYDTQYDNDIEIKGRGTSSWHYEKKPYKLKLSKKTDLFGFGKSKHYVLLANYLDISNLRNTIAYRFASYAGLTSTDTTWVDVIFNDEYVGIYQLAEHIRVGKQLIDITDWEDEASNASEEIAIANNFDKNETKELEKKMTEDLSWITSDVVKFNNEIYKISDYYKIDKSIKNGYILEFDDEDDKEISNFITSKGIKVHVNKPEYLNTNSEMFNYVQDLIQDFENAIYQKDGYNEKGMNYLEYMNIDSLVSYWLTNEIFANDDASSRSRFVYIGEDNKITFGPVWDFDISSNSFRAFSGYKGWAMTDSLIAKKEKQDIFKEIVDDPYIQMKIQEKYWELRSYLIELTKDNGLIDQYVDYLYEAGVKNEMLWINKYMSRSFTGNKGDVEIYKTFLKNRLMWLDTVFKNEETTTNSLKLSSSNSFKKDNNIKITTSLVKINDSYILNDEGIVNINIKTNYKDYNVYINGIYYGNYKTDVLTFDNSVFNENDNKKNVLTIISGKHLNYITLKNNNGIDNIKDINKYEINDCNLDNLDLVHIEERTVSNENYGIKESYYSNKCYKYFDLNGNLLKAKDVITSPSTSSNYYGLHFYIKLLTMCSVLIIIDLIFLIRSFIKMRKCYNRIKNS